jgi:hypothetical protein
MLTALRKEYQNSGYVFTTERDTPFTTDAVNRQIKIIGQRAGLRFPVHFHMLRHSCGYKLDSDGIDTRAIQEWLGARLHHPHHALHGIEPDKVQELLAGLTPSGRRGEPRSGLERGRAESPRSVVFSGRAAWWPRRDSSQNCASLGKAAITGPVSAAAAVS